MRCFALVPRGPRRAEAGEVTINTGSCRAMAFKHRPADDRKRQLDHWSMVALNICQQLHQCHMEAANLPTIVRGAVALGSSNWHSRNAGAIYWRVALHNCHMYAASYRMEASGKESRAKPPHFHVGDQGWPLRRSH